MQRTRYVTISPVVPPIAGGSSTVGFAAGGPVPSSSLLAAVSAGQIMSQVFAASLSETVKSEPLVETWSNEKVEAWRVIDVTVEKGDPDGLWLGFPHPDGPSDPIVISLSHPVGVELHAKCSPRHRFMAGLEQPPVCDETPGENCQSGYGSGCGFYAYKTRDDAVTLTRNIFRFDGAVSVARVLLWGKIIEHKNGYRAEILEVVEVEPPMPQELSMGIGFYQAAGALARLGRSLTSTTNPFIGGNIVSGGT